MNKDAQGRWKVGMSNIKLKMRAKILSLLLLACLLPARAARLKDLVSIEGVRDNMLIGYGLVVGLNPHFQFDV